MKLLDIVFWRSRILLSNHFSVDKYNDNRFMIRCVNQSKTFVRNVTSREQWRVNGNVVNVNIIRYTVAVNQMATGADGFYRLFLTRRASKYNICLLCKRSLADTTQPERRLISRVNRFRFIGKKLIRKTLCCAWQVEFVDFLIHV